MGFLNVLLVIVLVLSGIATVLLVLMHSGKGTGLSEMISASVMPSGAGTGIVEKNLDRLTVITAVIFGLCICIITPAFIPLFRLNAYIWPVVYLLFFNSMAGKRLFGLLALLLVIRISVVLTFKSEWNHIVPYSFYDFDNNFHEYHLYMQKEQ